MRESWFFSDPHFSHENIIKYCARPFDNAKQMNEAILENINAVVKPEDSVYCLGDVFYWRLEFARMEAMFRRIPGKKFLILGNHDRLHQMKKLDWQWIAAQREITVNEQKIFLNHYAQRTWNHAFHGSWHLYGHSHGTMQPLGQSMPVDVDCWDFQPVNFETVRQVMQKLGKNSEVDRDSKKVWSGNQFLLE